MGPCDVVYVEKRGPWTDPWGTPVTSWCALDTSPPQPCACMMGPSDVVYVEKRRGPWLYDFDSLLVTNE